MKKLFLVSVLFFVLWSSNLNAQCEAHSLSYDDAYELKKLGLTLGDTYTLLIKAGDSDFIYRDIYDDYTYLFVFLADDGVKDIDGYIKNTSGTTLAEVTESNDGDITLVSYSPPYDSRVQIKANIYEAYCSDCYYCVTILVYYREND